MIKNYLLTKPFAQQGHESTRHTSSKENLQRCLQNAIKHDAKPKIDLVDKGSGATRNKALDRLRQMYLLNGDPTPANWLQRLHLYRSCLSGLRTLDSRGGLCGRAEAVVWRSEVWDTMTHCLQEENRAPQAWLVLALLITTRMPLSTLSIALCHHCVPNSYIRTFRETNAKLIVHPLLRLTWTKEWYCWICNTIGRCSNSAILVGQTSSNYDTQIQVLSFNSPTKASRTGDSSSRQIRRIYRIETVFLGGVNLGAKALTVFVREDSGSQAKDHSVVTQVYCLHVDNRDDSNCRCRLHKQQQVWATCCTDLQSLLRKYD
ncbi:hypothetical protein J6590_064869 [Homalodisca vitripennis]|nr:hypothetical protein J6590_064869 [Homalodisca vitripennis]